MVGLPTVPLRLVIVRTAGFLGEVIVVALTVKDLQALLFNQVHGGTVLNRPGKASEQAAAVPKLNTILRQYVA